MGTLIFIGIGIFIVWVIRVIIKESNNNSVNSKKNINRSNYNTNRYYKNGNKESKKDKYNFPNSK